MKLTTKIFLAIVLVLVVLAVSIYATNETYTRATKVVELDEENDLVTLRDSLGYEWQFYGIEDWLVGDGCILTMKTNRTETIFDDEIVRTQYFVIEGLA